LGVALRHRDRRAGSALIAAFAAQAASAGRPGIHVVTGERARNIRFYEKNDFRPLATARWNSVDVVFMGRLLRPRDAEQFILARGCRSWPVVIDEGLCSFDPVVIDAARRNKERTNEKLIAFVARPDTWRRAATGLRSDECRASGGRVAL